jgi:hypothetical protein
LRGNVNEVDKVELLKCKYFKWKKCMGVRAFAGIHKLIRPPAK